MTSSNLFGNCELKALKPQNQEEFGYFLAGLIDADGHIKKNGSVVIAFHLKEISVAYYLKNVIGFGSIYKVKNRRAATYECMNKAGLTKVASYIRNKLKHAAKITQFNERLVKRLNCEKTVYTLSDLRKNHWLAGFLQGDGCLVLYQVKRGLASWPRKEPSLLETRIFVQVAQKKIFLLESIKTFFNGRIQYRAFNNSYQYNSVSFQNALDFIGYLDQFQLIGSKLREYKVWRKAFSIIQSKQHNTKFGEAQLFDLKEQLFLLRKKSAFFSN